MLLDCTRELVDVEWVVLALLAVQPISRWYASCAYYARGIVARVWVEQPAESVKRAFTTLDARGLIAPHEDGDGSAFHDFWTATPRGRTEVSAWLETPTSSDSRLLSLKLLLTNWLELDTPALSGVGAQSGQSSPAPSSAAESSTSELRSIGS